jgi:hypothetical protein
MSKPRTNKKEMVEMILLICVILLIPLFFAVRSLAGQPGLEPTPVPTRTVVANPPGMTPTMGGAQAPVNVATVTPVPVAQGNRPPPCQFPLANIPVQESVSVEYTFSEPKVVLTAPQGNIFKLMDWLPDNRQLLMTEDLFNSYVMQNNNAPMQSIQLYNSETGDKKIYATRAQIQEPPIWDPKLNAVIFPVKNYTKIDNNKAIYEFSQQVWVSYGDPGKAKLLADNLTQLDVAMKPTGDALLFLLNSEIRILDASLKVSAPTSFSGTTWDYAIDRRNQHPVSFTMTWQPGSSLIFAYSEGAMGGGGYTYILNSKNGDVCELSLGGWAKVPRWSADGRYLAFIRVENFAFLYPNSDLVLLDTITGRLIKLSIIPLDEMTHYYINDFVWASDDVHILALLRVVSDRNQPGEEVGTGLYLIDSRSSQSINIIPDFALKTNTAQSLAWSPDGTKLLVRCPTKNTDQLCFISVRTQGR